MERNSLTEGEPIIESRPMENSLENERLNAHKIIYHSLFGMMLQPGLTEELLLCYVSTFVVRDNYYESSNGIERAERRSKAWGLLADKSHKNYAKPFFSKKEVSYFNSLEKDIFIERISAHLLPIVRGDMSGATLLHYAVNQGHFKIAHYLVDKLKADFKRETVHGQRTLDLLVLSEPDKNHEYSANIKPWLEQLLLGSFVNVDGHGEFRKQVGESFTVALDKLNTLKGMNSWFRWYKRFPSLNDVEKVLSWFESIKESLEDSDWCFTANADSYFSGVKAILKAGEKEWKLNADKNSKAMKKLIHEVIFPFMEALENSVTFYEVTPVHYGMFLKKNCVGCLNTAGIMCTSDQRVLELEEELKHEKIKSEERGILLEEKDGIIDLTIKEREEFRGETIRLKGEIAITERRNLDLAANYAHSQRTIDNLNKEKAAFHKEKRDLEVRNMNLEEKVGVLERENKEQRQTMDNLQAHNFFGKGIKNNKIKEEGEKSGDLEERKLAFS